MVLCDLVDCVISQLGTYCTSQSRLYLFVLQGYTEFSPLFALVATLEYLLEAAGAFDK